MNLIHRIYGIYELRALSIFKKPRVQSVTKKKTFGYRNRFDCYVNYKNLEAQKTDIIILKYNLEITNL